MNLKRAILPLSMTLCVSTGAMAMNVETVTEGLDTPWGMTFVDNHTLVVTERNGDINAVDLNTHKQKTLLSVPQVFHQGHGGLLDVAQSPFDKNTLYFTYSKNVDGQGATTLAAATYKDGKISNFHDLLVTDSRTTTSVGFGSRITFDDNSVYFSVGDRGVAEHAQNTLTHAGSILRLMPDGSIPNDNPFVNDDAVRDEIWSYGHRNIQGLAYDAKTESLWSVEHGEHKGDELNLIKKGSNFGWPLVSGQQHQDGLEQPVKVFNEVIAPSSLVIYYGENYSELNGKLLVSSLVQQDVLTIKVDDHQKVTSQQEILNTLKERVRDIEVSQSGEIYLSTDNGNIYHLSK
ncbi:PQQ-dependent sugar dehydrogenase [Vibrio sp. SS-MA-C1-2]|uniref:PQQ-dependent sugar dehydrogenase n=1 Tax=Vibrio sp. SS-MA-C1-2 TaxID=2908646 RepID=UPI001F2A1C88|nr:PQQ-dependent sugar dehydrogenase [Vibrio sp. SS-MA-C1-2]UJF18735.1 PQQ-dependent sugar dehydrogenase [Vibrio sp. SS-MA-C1-2]